MRSFRDGRSPWMNRPQVLQAGMPAEVLIKKRARTALDYLLQPVADAMGRAWHED